MPYYQYEIHVETKLTQHELEKIEKNEENQFNSVLSKPKNRVIDILDLFFPPRFKKKEGRFEFYPTLPCIAHRQRALESIQAKIKSHQIQVMVDCDINNIPGFNNLAVIHTTPYLLHPGRFPFFKSCAVVDYDHEGKALIEDSTLLGSLIDTKAFIELVIECDILPFELFNLEIVLDFYMRWNKKRLDRLVEGMNDEEGWSLFDAVSYAAGYYAMKSWVSGRGYINGFFHELPFSEQPLRWRKEIPENLIEAPGFQRPKGKIDSGMLPERVVNMQNHWNNVFKNALDAMRFGDIKHTGGEKVNRCNTRVREEQFFSWAKRKEYLVPHTFLPNGQFVPDNMPKQKQQRTSLLHQCIADHRQQLINKTSKVPNNQSVWTSIYKVWMTGDIPFIDGMSRWSGCDPRIEWTSEHGNPNRPDIMTKKSFQTHMSGHFPKNSK